MHTPDDLLQTAFIGPWVRSAPGAARVQHVYSSVLHWYEAAKFMPHRPDLRDAILFSPSLKEARKFARLRKEDWRSDWNLVRPSILIAGLGFLALQRPELGLVKTDLANIRAGLAPMGLPDRFLEACVERFDVWRNGPRVGFLGADLAPEPVVGKAASKLVSTLPTWTLVSPCNGRAAWRLHDWCLSHFVPVHYVGLPTDRFSRTLQHDLVDKSDQVVVFEERGTKRHDVVITHARRTKRKVSLELYAPEGDRLRQIDGLT
jgi:hypothetical protein